MLKTAFLPALVCLLFFIPRAIAGDAIDLKRPPVKEPVYQSKNVEYFLLVFGAEAKTRVWVVRDGDNWYFDRNGNGDLTEADKRVEGKYNFAPPIRITAGKTSYLITHFNFNPPQIPGY